MDTLNFKTGKGLLDFAGMEFINGKISYEFDRFNAVANALQWTRRGVCNCSVVHGCRLEVRTDANQLRLSVENKSGPDVFIKSITISFSPGDMSARLASSDYLEYIHSSNFESGSGVKKVGLGNRWLKHNPGNSFVYILSNIQDGNSFLFSILPPHNGDLITFKALHDSPHLEGDFGLEIKINFQALLKPGKKINSTPIQFQRGNNPLKMLAALGLQWKNGLKRRPKKTLTGWNSWDYYAGAVTSGDIYQNQEEARKHFGDKIKYFVIDEGYEPQWGVWDAGNKFPEGLKKYCARIKSKGGVPGVWTAALQVNYYNPLYRNHPSWFARKSNGAIFLQQLSYGMMACLDITNPEVEDHIYKIFKKLKGYGFEYFKVDFTQIALLCDKFSDPAVPRGNILRKTFSTIRRAIGNGAYLLACGAPFESVAGIVDAARTSGDIHNYPSSPECPVACHRDEWRSWLRRVPQRCPAACRGVLHWGHILANARSNFARWWMHGNLWNNDPDFLIVRCKETSPDKLFNRKLEVRPLALPGADYWLCGREMNYNEAEVYALSIYLTDGDVFLGDNLAKLNDKGIRLLRRVIEAPKLTKPAVPLDLFAGHDHTPSVLLAEEKDFWVLGLFNWEEDTDEIAVNLEGIGIKTYKRMESFFGDKIIDAGGNTLKLKLKPRSCKGFFIYKK